MKLILRLCGQYGNFSTQCIDVDPTCSLQHLRSRISERFNIASDNQILKLRQGKHFVRVTEGETLSECGITDKTVVFVEEVEEGQREETVDLDDFELSRSMSARGRLLCRLGLSAVEEEEEAEVPMQRNRAKTDTKAPQLSSSRGSDQPSTALDLSSDEEISSKFDSPPKRNSSKYEERFKPPKPPVVRGEVLKAGNLIFTLNHRFIVLNPDQGTLARYRTAQDYPLKPREVIPLKDIVQVRRIEPESWRRDNYSYFEVFYKMRHIFACKTESDADSWVRFIYQGVVHAAYVDDLLNLNLLSVSGTYNDYLAAITQTTAEIVEIGSPSKYKELLSPMLPATPTPPSPTTSPSNQQQGRLSSKLTLKDFEVLRVLGSGAFGKVFKVRSKSNGQIFALKALKKRNLVLKNQLKYALTEANVLRKADSPFVLSLQGTFQTPGYLYLVMDFCPGGDLAFHLAQRGRFDETEARFFAAELVLAIERIHSMNVVYRDLKPENILLGMDGHIKLADFGLSKEGIGSNDAAKSFCGSPAYLSPEMLANAGVGRPADVYGIGATLYEMLVGEPPYFSEELDKIYANIRAGRLTFPSNVSEQARSLLTKLLNKDPRRRPSLKEIRNDPFFKGIDWQKLASKRIRPPKFGADALDEEDHATMPIADTDYSPQNSRVNRVANFSFVRPGAFD